MKDIHHKYDSAQLLAPQSISASTKTKHIDRAVHEAVELESTHGAVVGSDASNYITPVVEHSETETDADFAAVTAEFLLGSFDVVAANEVQRVGYIGAKQFVRINYVETGAVTSAIVGACAMVGHSRVNPPVAPTPATAS